MLSTTSNTPAQCHGGTGAQEHGGAGAQGHEGAGQGWDLPGTPCTSSCPSSWNRHVSHQDEPFLDQMWLCWSRQTSILPVPSSAPAHSGPRSHPWPGSLQPPLQSHRGSPCCGAGAADSPEAGWGLLHALGCPQTDPAPHGWVLPGLSGAERSCYLCPQRADASHKVKGAGRAPEWGRICLLAFLPWGWACALHRSRYQERHVVKPQVAEY